MDKRQNVNALALSGVMLAAAVMLNFAASFHLFRIDMIFYLLSGAIVYFIARRSGIRIGITFFAAASILSFVIVPDKVCVILFIGVFGPCAVIQAAFFKAESSERIGRTLSAVFSILVFIMLFLLSAFILVYGGGFLAHLDLPMAGTPIGTAVVIVFGVFSAVVAFVVNRNISELVERRLGGAVRSRMRSTSPHIDLPKLYQENEE